MRGVRCIVSLVTLSCRLVHAASSWNVHAPALTHHGDGQDSQQQQQQQQGDRDDDSLEGVDEFEPLVTSDLPVAGSSSSRSAISVDDVPPAALVQRAPPRHVRVALDEAPLALADEHTAVPSTSRSRGVAAVEASASASAARSSGVKKVVVRLPVSFQDTAPAVAAAASAHDATVSVIPSTPSHSRFLQHTPSSASRGFGATAAAAAWAPSTPGSGAVR